MVDANPAEIVAFWRDAGAPKWFNGGQEFDADCRHRFEEAHQAAARGELAAWLNDAESSLALLILLDQIPRNIYRDSGHAFATDGLARRYAREALKPEVTFVDYTVTTNDESVEAQVAAASDERDRVALWGRILPITFTALGLVALVGGALLGSFSLRAESLLIDPGLDDTGNRFFGGRGDEGEPVPGAEAKTEKLPAQRPSDLPPDRPV